MEHSLKTTKQQQKTTPNPKETQKKESLDLKKHTNICYFIFKRLHDKFI